MVGAIARAVRLPGALMKTIPTSSRLPVVRHASGHAIATPGPPPSEIYLIEQGWITREMEAEDRGRQVTALLLPGDLCDPLWIGGHAYQTYRAVGNVTLRCLQPPPRGGHATMADLAASAAGLEARVSRWTLYLARYSAMERIALLFCEVHDRLIRAGRAQAGECEWLLDADTLAECTGLTRSHATRALAELKLLGLASIRANLLRIPDPARLARVAGFDPSYLADPDARRPH